MMRILFVCHGNICRSPMAEYMLKDLVAKRGRAEAYEIASAATSAEELGNPIYPAAAAELTRRGIPLEARRAVLLQKGDYDRYDLLIGMDDRNLRNMRRLFGGDPAGKVCKLLDFAGGGDVADPWYTGRFEAAADDILAGCRALLERLESCGAL